MEVGYWVGMAAPAATSPAIIAKLEKALSAAVAGPETKKRLTEMGAVVTPLAAEAFGAFIRNDLKYWSDFVTEAKIKLE
jgi:tripartite-type tricarboxylate transporter receptor subunit TctC